MASVRDSPWGRLGLLQSCYAPLPGAPARSARYRSAALAFMGWQVRRGLLNPPGHPRPGSPWWRAVNERLLLDTCEARARVLGHPGPVSSPSVEPWVTFARRASARSWYQAHNLTVLSAYAAHRDLAEREDRVERFFVNLVLTRVLYAHAMVAAPRLALGPLAPIAPWLGDPRRRAMTGIFLSVARVLPDHYPLQGSLDDYLADEHTVGRLLDAGLIVPRLDALHRWSARELGLPTTDLLREGIPAYAWDPEDRAPWARPPRPLARALRWSVPPPA